MQTITAYEIINHGIEHAQYFQGCGVSFTRFDKCYTGCGTNPKEAFDDALDGIAQESIDTSEIFEKDELYKHITRAANKMPGYEPLLTVEQFVKNQGEEITDDCELYYYISIRYNTAE